MRTKKGARGFMAVKVDMEKAYDRLDWRFLQDTLKCLKLDDHFI